MKAHLADHSGEWGAGDAGHKKLHRVLPGPTMYLDRSEVRLNGPTDTMQQQFCIDPAPWHQRGTSRRQPMKGEQDIYQHEADLSSSEDEAPRKRWTDRERMSS